jgi:hypothetical protein
MKRSEAINKIAVSLWGKQIPINCSELAKLILDETDKIGMLPPGYLKPIPDGCHPLVPGDFLNDNGIWCTPGVQEWEPEE